MLCGARSFAAIGQWAEAHAGSIRIDTLSAGAADESTFRRVFALVDADALAAAIGAWRWTLTATLVHLPIDGVIHLSSPGHLPLDSEPLGLPTLLSSHRTGGRKRPCRRT